MFSAEAGVLVRKLSQLTQLKAKRANPRYFSMLCGSCELAGCRKPAYRGLRAYDSRLRPHQTLVSYTLANLA
jgi:hypothetical protein